MRLGISRIIHAFSKPDGVEAGAPRLHEKGASRNAADGKKAAAAKASARRKIDASAEKAAKRRARARWATPALRFGAPVSAAGLLGLAGYFAITGGYPQRAFDMAWNAGVETTIDAGFQVETVHVSGRRETSKETLLAALGVKIGDPILTFDLDEALERIRAIGWVEEAAIERRLPGHLHIHLAERQAAAIWQQDGEFVLVDAGGTVIGDEGLERHKHLKVVVGAGAPERTAQLLATLATEPGLEERVIAAVWVGGRRWNLRLDNGMDIRLPEDDLPAAWARLAQLDRDHRLLERDIEIVDLRQSDRLIVRMTEQAAERRHARKDET